MSMPITEVKTMKTRYLIPALLLAACSGDPEDPARELAEAADKARDTVEQALPEDPPANFGEAIERVGQAITDGEQSVAAADLKALIPESLIGLERVSHEAQRSGGMGITVSKAQAQYGDSDTALSLLITDLGAASGLAAMSRNMFQNEIDREDESGFERTTEYQGHQSYQRMMRVGDQSLAEVMVFVNDRFTVQLDGQNIEWDDMMKALEKIDLQALASMAPATN